MSGRYILQGKKPIPCSDLLEWGRWMEANDRIVKQETFMAYEGNIKREFKLSTVFLGIDHNFIGGEPLLFETMVFGGIENDGACLRCSTWNEAELQHEKVKILLRCGKKV